MRAMLPGLLLLALSPHADAQDAAQERVVLRLSPAPGKPVRFVHEVEFTEAPDGGLKVLKAKGLSPTTRRVSSEFSLETSKRRSDGAFDGVLRFGLVSGSGTEYLGVGGGGEEKFRSDMALPRRPLLREFALRVAGIGGTSFKVVLDAGASCRSLTADATLQDERARILQANEILGEDLGIHLDPVNVSRHYGRLMLATRWPSRPLSVGDTWEMVPEMLDSMVTGRFVGRLSMKVERVEEKEILVAGEGTVGFEVDESMRSAIPVLGAISMISSKFSSRVRVSRIDGLPLEGSTEAVYSYRTTRTIEPEGYVSDSIEKTTLKRVEAWPSEKKR